MIVQRLDKNKMAVNSYVIHNEGSNNAIAIDPGLNYNNIVFYCNENNCKINAIVLTHGHYDHITDTMKLKNEYNCPVYAHTDEQIILNSANKNLSSMTGEKVEFDADLYVKEGDVIEIGDLKFDVISTPGHTKGGICLLNEEILISGDTLFKGSMGRTDLYSGSEDEMMNSLRRLSNLPESLKVYPGHGPSSTIELEKKHNPFMRMAINNG